MSKIKDIAIRTLENESNSILGLIDQLNDDFEATVACILACSGKVIVTGMGKSGIIGKKIAATFASTGTPSFFIHPAEAFHGDLGMISPNDVVIAISYSGESDEVLQLIPFLKDNKNTVIAMAGFANSTLVANAHYHLPIWIEQEACPLHLAPTSSTTATLALGDALAIAVMDQRGFKSENYARFHPGGSLGKRLLSKVRDYMHMADLPFVTAGTNIMEVVHQVTKGRFGLCIVGDNQTVEGLITDGDLRRAMEKYKEEFFNLTAADIMTLNPVMIDQNEKLHIAQKLLLERKITTLLVTGEEKIEGVIQLYDIKMN